MLDERYLSELPSDRSRLVRVAQRLLGSTPEAEDAVQESYLRALEADAGGSAAPDEAKAWLTTVMQNLAIDQMRRRDWMRRWLQDAEARAPAPHAPSAEDQAALAEETDRALHLLASTLSPAEGAVLLLREVFEASYGDIAQASGKTEDGCRQQVHRALVRLRQRAERGPPEGRAAEGAQAEANEAAFHVYLQSLRNVDMQPLLGLLSRHAPSAAGDAKAAPKARCEVAQVGGSLALMLTLGSRFVCLLPLGVRSELDPGHREERAAACS